MSSKAELERAQDLEMRIRVYEALEGRSKWPGALTAPDYIAIIVMTLVLVISFNLWRY
jgi:hypothetical protein